MRPQDSALDSTKDLEIRATAAVTSSQSKEPVGAFTWVPLQPQPRPRPPRPGPQASEEGPPPHPASGRCADALRSARRLLRRVPCNR